MHSTAIYAARFNFSNKLLHNSSIKQLFRALLCPGNHKICKMIDRSVLHNLKNGRYHRSHPLSARPCPAPTDIAHLCAALNLSGSPATYARHIFRHQINQERADGPSIALDAAGRTFRTAQRANFRRARCRPGHGTRFAGSPINARGACSATLASGLDAATCCAANRPAQSADAFGRCETVCG